MPGLDYDRGGMPIFRLSPEIGNKELLELQVAKHVNFVYSAFRRYLTLCGEQVYNQHMSKKKKQVMYAPNCIFWNCKLSISVDIVHSTCAVISEKDRITKK